MTNQPPQKTPSLLPIPPDEDVIPRKIAAIEVIKRLNQTKYASIIGAIGSLIAPLAYITNTYLGSFFIILAVGSESYILYKVMKDIDGLKKRYSLGG